MTGDQRGHVQFAPLKEVMDFRSGVLISHVQTIGHLPTSILGSLRLVSLSRT